jgi:hypothetical protein
MTMLMRRRGRGRETTYSIAGDDVVDDDCWCYLYTFAMIDLLFEPSIYT